MKPLLISVVLCFSGKSLLHSEAVRGT
uniref:Uncharacterized protein n=1 Tax=Anguilla anguilla TaxID=7936 RepID=A0A0E9VQL8_ANGAN